MVEPSRAVFISYASQDAEAARRIAAALQDGGVEVWLDQSELRGGEAWDASIRRQIKTCRLFLAVISASTQAREEGYFRREWNLAVARTLDMAEDAPFLLPVVIDATGDAEARVPERFRDVQWTRLPGGQTSPAFVDRTRALLGGRSVPAVDSAAAMPAGAMAPEARGQPPATAQHRRPLPWATLVAAAGVLLVIVAALLLVPPWQRREHARNVLLPAIESAAANMVRSNRQIFDQAMQARRSLPDDPTLAKLMPVIVNSLSVETDPPGAEVFWKDYDSPASPWRSAGTTPLRGAQVPRDFLRLEIRKAAYQTIELAAPMFALRVPAIDVHLKLDHLGSLPEGMVRIPATTTAVDIVGIAQYGPRHVPEFLMDRFEVTNKQFKAFVDAGGYTNAAYWTIPIREHGRVVPREEALASFKDRTNRPGPATWEAGSYPDGAQNEPVTGVSWYEAAAYAEFVHKRLPSVFHWAAVADTARSEFLVPLSNFGHKSPVVVGSLPGFSTYGIYDIAGNAREWTYNQRDDSDLRFILGGGWNDPSYAFNDSFAQPGLDRDESNGFRCIRELEPDAAANLWQSLTMAYRDYAKEAPVGDAVFAGFLRQFVYDKTPVEPKIERTVEGESWRAEEVSIDAGYNNERLTVYVYLPKAFAGALQPVVFFSGSNGIHETTFDPNFVNGRVDFIVKSGRALVIPIFKGTYERRDELKSDLQETTVRYKDHVVDWVKEYSRTVDYLETRKDIRPDHLAYLGWSWGGFMGGIIPAVERRIKVVVLNVGGMGMEKALPEVDQINYLPRVTQPTLMLNGSYDMYFPVESSQKPMFRLLGTPAAQKKMIVYPSGHLVPGNEFIKETLSWLDTYLGPAH